MLNSFATILEQLLKTIPVQYNGRSLRPGRQNQLSREKWSVFQRLTDLTRLIYYGKPYTFREALMDEEPRESFKNRRRGFQTRRGRTPGAFAHTIVFAELPEWPQTPRKPNARA